MSLERCPEGVMSVEFGPEDVSILERCPHFQGVLSMELGPEDVSLLEILSSSFIPIPYVQDYDAFEDANESEELETFLKLK